MGAPVDYGAVLSRLEAGDNSHWVHDRTAIMSLLGYEVRPHARTALACRKLGEGGAMQSLPRFDSADDFDMWVLGKFPGLELNDAGHDGPSTFYAGVEHPDFGNDYGYGRRLGTAMWAAFVALIGRVDREQTAVADAAERAAA